MKPISAWRQDVPSVPERPGLEVLPARVGGHTLKLDQVFLHSRYDPAEEARRLVDSAAPEAGRPVFVLGLGLGYHVAELLSRGFEVFVVEPEPAVVQAALDAGPDLSGALLYVGPAAGIAEDDEARAAAKRNPQWLMHPPSARLHADYAAEAQATIAAAALGGQRMNIAVVGPMYGGSLPIAGYLCNAFRALGHQCLLVDNDPTWPLYEQVSKGVRHAQASAQLGNMLAKFMNEWTYARVAEFDPEICIVLAQAPVDKTFPLRLAKNGIVTAYWFVENWRHMGYWREIAPYYDAFFHIQPGGFEQQLEEAGCTSHAFVQTACDPALHRPVELSDDEREEFTCDLSFAGAGYYNRLQLFKGLTDYDFRIWGVDWPERELAPLVQGGERRFDSETFMKIVAGTRINLNLHSSATHEGVDPSGDAVNPRVFEIAAAGGFQVCDPCINLDRHFTEEEVPRYRSLTELRERIDYYLPREDERRAIAARARERALAEHTYEHRAQAMLDFLIERHGARIQKKGVRVQRSFGETAALLPEAHPLGEWLRRHPDDLPFTLEQVNACVDPRPLYRSYPEQVFAYMRDVHDFAEQLLKAPR
ncbi:MAG: glycosyltransferase [Candidatus Hydrogenedens sp.]|nr:glycosyltransferase [Candidatus Hydrogenedens sp.]